MYNKQEPKNKVFALAADCYRVRVLEVLEERPVDFDWREDVLYTAPKAYPSKPQMTYRVQVLTNDRKVYEIANLRSKREANKRLKILKEDLRLLTKMKFDEKHGIEDTTEFPEKLISPVSLDKELYGNAMIFLGVQNHPKK